MSAYNPLDYTASTPTEDEIAQYKADWKRRGFPDAKLPDVEQLNSPVYQGPPEYTLWENFFQLLVQDYYERLAYRRAREFKEKRRVFQHGVSGYCSCCKDERPLWVETGALHDGRPVRVNRAKHTNHDCAVYFVEESAHFEEICSWLAIEPEWLRRKIRTMDPAKIHFYRSIRGGSKNKVTTGLDKVA